MPRLFKFELRKLTRGRAFYISGALIIIFNLVGMLTLKATQNIVDPMFKEEFICTGLESMLLAAEHSYFIMVSGIFTAVFLCDDYGQQTLKNIYSRGYSRESVITVKLVTIVLSSSVLFLLSALSDFAFASLIFGIGKADASRLLAVLIVQFISCVANISLFFMLSSVVKKKGLAITSVIVFPIVSELVLSLLDLFLQLEDFRLSDYWLTTFPSSMTSVDVPDKKLLICLFASLIYTAAFAFLSIFFSKKNEA